MKVKTILMVSIFIVFSLTLTSLMINNVCKAQGNEIYVWSEYFGIGDGSADKPYKTIQEAIESANNGDTIYVFGGFYQEHLVINKKLKIEGGIDEEETVIDSEFDYRYLVEITADEVEFKGFTLSDSDNETTSPIGALIGLKSDDNKVLGNFITNTESYGIYVASTSENNIIYDNIVNNTKVGIYVYSSSTNDIANNEISNCSQYGINIESVLESTRLYNNDINMCETGINIQNSGYVNITSNTISNCTSYALSLYNSGGSLVKGNTFHYNIGDGIYLQAPYCDIVNNTFKNNRRGLTLASNNCLIENNTFYDSTASGIYAQSTSNNNKIYLNKFKRNTVSAYEFGSNLWFYENMGNYWDDYGYVDRDLDGIGDDIYSKNGVLDSYPLGYFLKPPKKPSDISPKDYATGVGLKVTLKAHVEDPDSDELTVYFYKEDGTLIDSITQNPLKRVISDSDVYCKFILGFNTTFAWYVVVNDSILENQSGPFIFYTRITPPDNIPPVAEAGGPYYAETNQMIQFDSTGSKDDDGKIDFYRWNFGDGSTEIIDQSPTHYYPLEGTYTVTLTVIDNDGSTDTDTASVYVSYGENDPPVATAVIPSKGNTGKIITFSSEGTIDPDGDKLSYLWDFGDGTSSTEKNPTHIYKKSGTYLVTLKASDKEYSNTVSDNIVIKEASTGIPGFELILLILSYLIVLLIIRNHNKNN